MSYYEAQSWQIPAQQASWEQPSPPSRAGRPQKGNPYLPIDRSSWACSDEFGHAARGSGCLRYPDRRYTPMHSIFPFLPKPSYAAIAAVANIHRGCFFHHILAYPRVEVNRALDNLNKSGKLFSLPSRRDSMPMMGVPRAFSDFGVYNGIAREFGSLT